MLKKLSKTLQRYENKSKSQPAIAERTKIISCLRLCKDTKIKANHNAPLIYSAIYWLSKTLQRYENKSKSQQYYMKVVELTSCLRLCKDTKIIHSYYIYFKGVHQGYAG